MSGDDLSGSLQANIAVLAVFSDSSAAIVRASVEPYLFTTRAYRDIITRAYAYFDQYKKPAKEHIADELEDLLTKEGEHAEMLSDVLEDLRSLWTDPTRGFNEAYVLTQMETFVRRQYFKVGMVEAHGQAMLGDIDAAEATMLKAMRARAASFTPGLTLKEAIKLLSNPDAQRDTLTIGIKELDKLSLGPARQELHLFIGPPKGGKSWWLTHCARRAIMQGWRGVYITLELSEKLVSRRLMQAIFALKTRDDAEVLYTKFRVDPERPNTLLSIDRVAAKNVKSISGYDKIGQYAERIDALRINNKILTKGFPTGALTVQGIEAYLDLLDSTQGFIPDFICLDYADLMRIPVDSYRLSLGELYKNLRGLAVERNLALITASQSTRGGASAKLLRATDVAEDFSKIGTADCVLTYSATEVERRRGLARLHVAAGRVEADKFTTIIAQSYVSGQFALKESFGMHPEYWTHLPKSDEEETGGTE